MPAGGEADEDREDRGTGAAATLPALGEGEPVSLRELHPAGHTTQPPARYTEATLVRRLEELGIGRPSTYASILDTITNERGYVWKKGHALVPTWTAFAKTQLLERYFPHLVDYAFTATMEEALDEVARGRAEAEKWLHTFYYGNGNVGLAELVSEQHLARIDMSEVNAIRIGTDPEGRELVVRVWRNGQTLHRGEEKVPVPADLAPDELTPARAVELLERGGAGPRVLGTDPETGLPVLVLVGRYGPFVQLGEAPPAGAGRTGKPKRASLLRSMDPERVTLDEALALLSLPRLVGTSSTGEPITAQTGRYGPYLKRGSETRSLDDEAQIFSITLAEAEARFAEPKRRGRTTRAPIAELGPHPETGAAVRVLEGRFGPYVTDGTTNASVPRGTDPAALDLAGAVELLRERAARLADSAPRRARASKAQGAAKNAKHTVRTPAKKKVAKKTVRGPAKRAGGERSTAGPEGGADDGPGRGRAAGDS
jgi:DNA topoisomerase-1